MLPIVKKHVDDAYLTVGVTEDMESFMEVIENLMPHYFYNATYVFKQTGKYEVVKLEQGHICFTTGDNLMSKINVRYWQYLVYSVFLWQQNVIVYLQITI